MLWSGVLWGGSVVWRGSISWGCCVVCRAVGAARGVGGVHVRGGATGPGATGERPHAAGGVPGRTLGGVRVGRLPVGARVVDLDRGAAPVASGQAARGG